MKIVKSDDNGVFEFTSEDRGKEFFRVYDDSIVVVDFPDSGTYQIEIEEE